MGRTTSMHIRRMYSKPPKDLAYVVQWPGQDDTTEVLWSDLDLLRALPDFHRVPQPVNGPHRYSIWGGVT